MNAAIDELFNKFLIPQMYAQVSQGQLSAEDSVKWAEGELKKIYG